MKKQNENKGLIFDIQSHCVHDGPGCRTTIFFSGCSLRCFWCCNPEGIFCKENLIYGITRCKKCYRCIEKCAFNAISIRPDGFLTFNRECCKSCKDYRCVSDCVTEALSISGRYVAVEQLMEILNRDRKFWGSQGGVTFSGGDPLFQNKFLKKVLQACHASYIHTAIETSGYLPTPEFMDIFNWVEWAFIDIKHMDPKKHEKGTGMDNKLILKNIRELVNSDWNGRLMIRIPIIPGYNDEELNLINTAEFLRANNLNELNILPCHRLAMSKYEKLGLICNIPALPNEDKMLEYKKIFESYNINCYLGHETNF